MADISSGAGRPRWGVVTGASAGIGRAVADALLKAGFRVAGVARDAGRQLDVAEKWRLRFVPALHDISLPGLGDALARQNAPLQDVELVVHCAGCARQGIAIVEMSDAHLVETIATNVTGTTLVVRDMAAMLVARGSGTLVVLGSVAAHDEAPLMAVYAASKAFVHQLVRCVRSDLHGGAVRVTCIQPGTTRTSLLDGQPGLSAQERFSGFTPLEAHDVACAVLWVHQQPPHVNVQEISLYPVAQTRFVRGVHRSGGSSTRSRPSKLETKDTPWPQ